MKHQERADVTVSGSEKGGAIVMYLLSDYKSVTK